MQTIRRAEDRGHANHGWLDSHHTFSFANYYDPDHMGFRTLRVINEDRVTPGRGFGAHGHRDMEIISYVLDGALAHADSMGQKTVIRPGEVQLMSAGSGVMHSECNDSDEEGVHFLQIWVVPNRRATKPGYQQRQFPYETRQADWRLLVSPDGQQDSLQIKQDARLWGTVLEPGDEVGFDLERGRGAWLHVVRGEIEVGGETLKGGDAISFEDVAKIGVLGKQPAELLLFDLA